jgi:excisionase family DNA binding protein
MKINALLTIPEVATRLNISRAEAYVLARQKGFPLVQLGERLMRVDPMALELWLDKKERRN